MEYKQAKLKDSNVALIGSAQDKALRLKAAQTEPAFQGAGQKPGIEIWRIEKFQVKKWPRNMYGTFYDGDSFIVLSTVKTPEGRLRWDVHYWLGLKSSQDEMGVAAYKTVELDDLLQTLPVQHREVQGHESALFKSYFSPFIILNGGVESGFNHVKPQQFVPVLLQIKGKTKLRVTQVERSYRSLNKGDSFVLDAGMKIFIWNGSKSGRTEQFRAAQIASHLKSLRSGKPEEIRLTEEGNNEFWNLLGGRGPIKSAEEGGSDLEAEKQAVKKLFRFSDATGSLQFTLVAEGNLSYNMLDGNDAFIIDTGNELFVWIGMGASQNERAFAMRYAMRYLVQMKLPTYIPITRVMQGAEPDYFKAIFQNNSLSFTKKSFVNTQSKQSSFEQQSNYNQYNSQQMFQQNQKPQQNQAYSQNQFVQNQSFGNSPFKPQQYQGQHNQFVQQNQFNQQKPYGQQLPQYSGNQFMQQNQFNSQQSYAQQSSPQQFYGNQMTNEKRFTIQDINVNEKVGNMTMGELFQIADADKNGYLDPMEMQIFTQMVQSLRLSSGQMQPTPQQYNQPMNTNQKANPQYQGFISNLAKSLANKGVPSFIVSGFEKSAAMISNSGQLNYQQQGSFGQQGFNSQFNSNQGNYPHQGTYGPQQFTQQGFNQQQGFNNQQGSFGQQGFNNQQGNFGQQGFNSQFNNQQVNYPQHGNYGNQQGFNQQQFGQQGYGQQTYNQQQGNFGQQGFNNQQGNFPQQGNYGPQQFTQQGFNQQQQFNQGNFQQNYNSGYQR